MKRIVLFILLLSQVGLNYAQNTFAKGYYINNQDEQIEGFILHLDWKDNPKQFKFKKQLQQSTTQTLSIEEVKEFAIPEVIKYRRYTLEVEMSKNLNFHLDHSPKLDQVEEKTLFLRVLIEGEASLYEYRHNELKKFFFTTKDQAIQQLFYKRYLVASQNDDLINRVDKRNPTIAGLEGRLEKDNIRKNNRFQQQIWNHLAHPQLDRNKLKRLRYKRKSIAKIFKSYNESKSPDFDNYLDLEERDLFRLGLKPGLEFASLVGQKHNLSEDYVFANQTLFSFGIDLEFILPFNNNKWAFFLEPTFRSYLAEDQQTVNDLTINKRAKYQSLATPMGLRHYFFLNEQSKLFVSAALLLDINLPASEVTFQKVDTEETPDALYYVAPFTTSMVFGLGYKFQNRYSLGLNYFLPRNIGDRDQLEYSAFSIILGYHLF